MPIVTFWSSNKKSIGQTISIAAVATTMAIEHNYKILVVSADINNYELESCFGKQESNEEIIKTLIPKKQINLESGINGLLKLADSNRLTPDIIKDYTKIVFKNRLEVLYSPLNIREREDTRDVLSKIQKIILNASRYYDYVFVDLKKGIFSEEQIEILNSSDVAIVNIDQGTRGIQSFFEIPETKKIFNKIIWNICRYDKNSKFNQKNLYRKILKEQEITVTPYNTLVMEAAQEGEIPDLLLRFKSLKKEDENKAFLKEIENTIEQCLQKYKETRLR